MDINLSELTSDELHELRSAVIQEIDRREQADRIAAQIRDLSMQLLDATGRENGAEWVQPQGAHDAYPEGWQVTHNGKLWASLVPGNVWEPGVSGWREVTPDGSPSEWVQPTGAHDAYALGDEVLHNGKRWVSLVNGNVWEPGTAGTETLWEAVVEESEEPTDPEEPEEPAEPEIPDWVQPTGAADAYSVGDLVRFEGVVYRSLINGNSWSPAAYPAGWQNI